MNIISRKSGAEQGEFLRAGIMVLGRIVVPKWAEKGYDGP